MGLFEVELVYKHKQCCSRWGHLMSAFIIDKLRATDSWIRTCRGQHPGICLLTCSPWAWSRVLSPGLGKALLSGASLWFTSQIPISSGSKTYILTLFPALAHSTPWTHYWFSLSDLQFLKLQIENSTCWINEASNKCKLKKWISWWQHLVNNGCSHAGFP